MTINISKRKSKTNGLWITTINGRDHCFAEPFHEANDRIERVKAVIEQMRAQGQSDEQIIGKYAAFSNQI